MDEKTIRTDGDVMRIAQKMQDLRDQMNSLIHDIKNGDHPNAEKIADDLFNECWFPAWPIHVVFSGLSKPDEWDYETLSDGSRGKPYHKAARLAQQKRRENRKVQS